MILIFEVNVHNSQKEPIPSAWAPAVAFPTFVGDGKRILERPVDNVEDSPVSSLNIVCEHVASSITSTRAPFLRAIGLSALA